MNKESTIPIPDTPAARLAQSVEELRATVGVTLDELAERTDIDRQAIEAALDPTTADNAVIGPVMSALGRIMHEQG